jgi:hypothetical protein
MLTSRLLIAKARYDRSGGLGKLKGYRNQIHGSGIQQLSKVSRHSNFSLAFEPEMVLSIAHKDWRSRSTVVSILSPAAAA